MTKRRKPLYVRKTESSGDWFKLNSDDLGFSFLYAERKHMRKFIILRSFLHMKPGAVCHKGEWKA